jgi:hypothetical protein
MRRFIPILVLSLIVGCGGPRPGDRLRARPYAVIYLDQDLFRTAAEIEKSKSGKKAADHEAFMQNRWDYLSIGSVVRVLERTADGLKVVVEKSVQRSGYDTDLEGQVGWVLESDISPD